MEECMKEKCLCCGYKTLPKSEEESIAFICPVCFWENDVFMKNNMTLEQARDNFKKYGACDKKFINNVREPNQDEI